jgi:hypothetical protein
MRYRAVRRTLKSSAVPFDPDGQPPRADIRHKAFSYAEITHPVQALAELRRCGHVRAIGEEDYASFVACLFKDALISGGKSAGFG